MKYYMINLNDDNFYYNDINLKFILKMIDSNIYKREEEKSALIHSYASIGILVPELKEKYNILSHKIDTLYSLKNLPSKLLLMENDGELYEFFTRRKITVDDRDKIKNKSVPYVYLQSYLDSYPTYSESLNNYFDLADSYKRFDTTSFFIGIGINDGKTLKRVR